MLGEFKSRRPPKNFNLLYLETNEVYFMSLKASLVFDSTSEEYPLTLWRVEGKLHLCSRSIFFEHTSIAKPIMRIKFSSGVLLRMMKNIDYRKAHKLVTIKKSENELKVRNLLCRTWCQKAQHLFLYFDYNTGNSWEIRKLGV